MNGVCFLVNILSLKKPVDSVSQTGLSDFGRLSICFSKFWTQLNGHKTLINDQQYK
jgi:hypothetical protein